MCQVKTHVHVVLRKYVFPEKIADKVKISKLYTTPTNLISRVPFPTDLLLLDMAFNSVWHEAFLHKLLWIFF
jgi:hypothetical protein